MVALLLSLAIHLVALGSWKLGQKMGWWNHHSSWLVKLTQKLTASKPRIRFPLQPKPQNSPPQNQEIPLTFLEVDPATAVDKVPENAKFYSDKNALASNPEPDTKPTPKVDGEQTQLVRVMEKEKPLPFPLQPAPPKPKGGEEAPKPGDMAFNKPRDPKPQSPGLVDKGAGQTVTTPTDKPRTLAMARQKATLSGRLVKQEGGAEHKGRVAFDTKATEFGEYDRDFIAAVESRWHYLIENNLVTTRPGKVILEFKLTHDGRITDMKIQDNEVGDILGLFCRNAVEDNQRYKEWPDEMRRKLGGAGARRNDHPARAHRTLGGLDDEAVGNTV